MVKECNFKDGYVISVRFIGDDSLQTPVSQALWSQSFSSVDHTGFYQVLAGLMCIIYLIKKIVSFAFKEPLGMSIIKHRLKCLKEICDLLQNIQQCYCKG